MKFKKLVSAAIIAAASSHAYGALLGVLPENPLFNYDSGGTAAFDGGTGSLTINATPTDFTNVGGPTNGIFHILTPPSVVMNLSLDSACDLTGTGDLTVMGDVDIGAVNFAPEFTGTLLTGEIVGLGFDPSANPTLQFDAKFAITGGTMTMQGTGPGDIVPAEYTVGAELAVTLTVEGSNFTGSCMDSWNGGAKGKIGHLEPVVMPDPPCFDVKKIKIREGRMCRSHWGSYGSSRSKIKVALSVGCDAGFDPTTSLISVGLDGETFDFPIGSFSQVGTANKYRAWIAGSPSLDATLNCDKGRFTFSASRADTSQIDNSDGVDVTLVLGGTTHTKNVMLGDTNHHHWRYGHRNVFYYHNSNPENCAVDGGEDDTDMHEIKCRHRSSGRIYTFKRSKGGFGKNLLVHDSHSGHFSMINTSKTTGVSCGWGDANFEVVGIEHKLESKSCTMLSEDDEDEDVEDNQHD